MTEPSMQSGTLQWKWVGITICLYAVFYLVPLFLLGGISVTFMGVWFFTGIIIIAAVAGYLSPGVTILEPAIAGAGLILLFFLTAFVTAPFKGAIFQAIIPLVIVMAIVFFLSLLGAWLGERAQKLWKTNSEKPA